MDKWNEICFLIKKHSIENSKEAFFQNEIVNIFEKLGWSRFRKEIETEITFQVGSKDNIRLDILISFEGEKLFCIELKRATDPGNEKAIGQLTSYMLQERMKYGIFIGANIKLFYDTPNDRNKPVKIIEIEFSENNEEGRKLIEIIKKDTFDEQRLIEYCNEKLLNIEDAKTKTEIIDYLTSQQGNKDILQLIFQDLKTKYSPKIIDEIENDIYIKILNKATLPIIENSHYNSKKDIVLKHFSSIKNNGEPKIGEFVRQTFSELVNEKLIGINEVEKLQRKDYSKQTFGIQYPFLSKELKEKYWKNYRVEINNMKYFVCSELRVEKGG